MALISVFMSPDMGVMIIASVIVSLLIYLYLTSSIDIKKMIMISISFIAGLVVYYLFSAKGDLAKYYFAGVIGYPIANTSVVLMYSIIVSGYLVLMYDMRKKMYDGYLVLLYIFFYSQCLMFYYVWHSDINGLLARAQVYLLAIVIFYLHVKNVIGKRFEWGRFVYIAGVMISIFMYGLSVANVFKQKARYDRIFTTHKVYLWDFDRAKIVSTMDPSYFHEAVSLINKYDPAAASICMISKYDNILPFLSHKYNVLPFQDLKWYNITDLEIRNSIRVIETEMPDYIYVDSDINRNFNNDIIEPSVYNIGYLHEESVWRAERLKLLAKVYSQVSDKYRLVEEGRLISVYKRISI
jgi:hypothetical protein